MKVLKPIQICTFHGCFNSAVAIACGRGHEYGKPAYYCKEHADIVANIEAPEYVVNCPNCRCKFGVN